MTPFNVIEEKMKYNKVIAGKFIERPNRFIAYVEIKGNIETVHVKNTGRCRELLLPGVEVILSVSDNLTRKTMYDLIAVYKKGVGLINMDSQAPNQVVREWLEAAPAEFSELNYIKQEFTIGKSRIDFYAEANNRKILIEVKGCTLEVDGVGYFPDAPTERGVKHLNELAQLSGEGYECYIAFVIQIPGVREVKPNIATHAEFGIALDNAKKAGVKVLFLPCHVEEDELYIRDFCRLTEK